MPELDSYTCTVCSERFKAVPDANAAESGYCSPACESRGKELA